MCQRTSRVTSPQTIRVYTAAVPQAPGPPDTICITFVEMYLHPGVTAESPEDRGQEISCTKKCQGGWSHSRYLFLVCNKNTSTARQGRRKTGGNQACDFPRMGKENQIQEPKWQFETKVSLRPSARNETRAMWAAWKGPHSKQKRRKLSQKAPIGFQKSASPRFPNQETAFRDKPQMAQHSVTPDLLAVLFFPHQGQRLTSF